MFQQPPPVIVRVVEQPVRETSIADLIFGSLATVAILLLIAAALGLLLGGILIGIKRLRARDGLPSQEERDRLRVTPNSTLHPPTPALQPPTPTLQPPPSNLQPPRSTSVQT